MDEGGALCPFELYSVLPSYYVTWAPFNTRLEHCLVDIKANDRASTKKLSKISQVSKVSKNILYSLYSS